MGTRLFEEFQKKNNAFRVGGFKTATKKELLSGLSSGNGGGSSGSGAGG